MLCGIPNVGPELARIALRPYGNIPNLVKALEENGWEILTTIKGIREKKAKILHDGIFTYLK